MLIKLAAITALGYAGYHYYRKMRNEQNDSARQTAVAGGPLSGQATIQDNPDLPPTEAAGHTTRQLP